MSKYDLSFLKDSDGNTSPTKCIKFFFAYVIPIFLLYAIYDTYNIQYCWYLIGFSLFGFVFNNIFLRIAFIILVGTLPFSYEYTKPYFQESQPYELNIQEIN